MSADSDAKRKADALDQEGFDLHAAGRVEEAVGVFRKAIALDPDNDSANANLAAALLVLERYAEALTSIQRAIQINSSEPISFNVLGMVLRELGKPAEAVAAHERSLSLRPDYPNGYFNLALALVDAERLPEAATACEASLTLKPGSTSVFHELAYIHRRLGSLVEEEGVLRRGVAVTGDLKLRFSLGHFLAGEKRWPEAMQELRGVLKEDPKFVRAHVELGYVLTEMGSIDEGIAEDLEALRLDSSNEQAKWNLNRARQRLKPEDNG